MFLLFKLLSRRMEAGTRQCFAKSQLIHCFLRNPAGFIEVFLIAMSKATGALLKASEMLGIVGSS